MVSSNKIELVWFVGEINYEKNVNMLENQVYNTDGLESSPGERKKTMHS